MQFISLESTELIQRTYSLLEKQSEDLLNPPTIAFAVLSAAHIGCLS